MGRNNARLYVGNVSRHARERDVEELFSKYGRIRDIQLKVPIFFLLLCGKRAAVFFPFFPFPFFFA